MSTTMDATTTSELRHRGARGPTADASSGMTAAKSVADTCREAVAKLEKGAEAYCDAAAEEFKNLEKRVEAYRDAVAEELEKWSLWAYRDQSGEEWDAQPACFITDYLLAIQCFCFAAYVALYASSEHELSASESASSSSLYVMYFTALGTSAAFGGLLHHVAFQALRGIAGKDSAKLADTARVFGFHLKRETVDQVIELMWRIVLGTSILNNFTLLLLAANRYLSETWGNTFMVVTGICYAVLAVYASIKMHVIFLMVGYLPALVFGAGASAMAFNWEWSHSANELLIYVIKLSGGLIQGLVVSPSHHSFNHNALSHVMLSIAATFMFLHSRL